MGQATSIAVALLRFVITRLQPEPAVEAPVMEGRRPRGAALWLGGRLSSGTNDVSVSDVLRNSSRRHLSRYGGRLFGGGRSERPLSPLVVVDSRSPSRQLGPPMADSPSVRLNVLSRNFDESPRRRSYPPEHPCLVDCCPRCSCVPRPLRRRRVVIPLTLAALASIGLLGLCERCPLFSVSYMP